MVKTKYHIESYRLEIDYRMGGGANVVELRKNSLTLIFFASSRLRVRLAVIFVEYGLHAKTRRREDSKSEWLGPHL